VFIPRFHADQWFAKITSVLVTPKEAISVDNPMINII
jgi:hypothetical protein